MMDIISFHVELTYKCNNKCFYCYNNLHQISTHMKFEDAKIVISLIKENLKKGKHVNLILTGGEPFQNFRVLYYICFSLIKYKNINISINTNFTCKKYMINKINILFNKYNKKLKLFISVPSLYKEKYNKITNSNNYYYLYKNLLYLNNKDIHTKVNIVLNKINYSSTCNTIKKLKLLNINNIKVSKLSYFKNKDTFIAQIYIDILDICRKFQINFSGSSTKLHELQENSEINKEFNLKMKKFFSFQCNAGHSLFCITPTLDIKPCPSVSDKHILFNIKNENFFEKIKELKLENMYSLICEKE